MYECVAFCDDKLIKHNIAQKLSTSINNLFEFITVELYIKQKIYASCLYRQPQICIIDFTDYMDNIFHCLNGHFCVWRIYIDQFKYDSNILY